MKYALLILLAGCTAEFGDFSVQDQGVFQKSSEQLVAPILFKAEQYFFENHGINKGWSAGTSIYLGTQEEVSARCRQDACACLWGQEIFVSETCDLCQSVVHESGHLFSFITYGDYDADHSRFGVKVENRYVYLFPMEVCDEQGK